jgi:integrase
MLTTDIIKALERPAKGSTITYDHTADDDPTKTVRGFGARITAAGAVAFILNYRVAGQERRLTIGSYPAWSVAKARHEARRLRVRIDQGEDPLAERIEARQAPTVRDLARRAVEDHFSRKRTLYDVEGQLAKWIIPTLGSIKVADVRPADIENLHRKVTKAGSPVRANRCVSTLSRMFSLGIRWEYCTTNPCKGAVERNAETKRNRYLSPVELARLSDALAAHSNKQAADLIRLLTLTGSRRGEAMAARWEDIDLEAGTWTKPGSTTKQATLHHLPLSAPTRELLARMKAEAKGPYLFGGRNGTGHVVDVKRSWGSVIRAAELPGVRLHDLRHTVASLLVSSGSSLPLIGALLGHSNTTTTARYAHLYTDPLREAAERVGAVVTGGKSADVVGLPKKAQP